jgi:hypothetical protein
MMYNISFPLGRQSLPATPAEFASCVNAAIQQKWFQIQAGYENPYASTGLPMNQLHGAAYDVALMSNIGIPRNQGGLGMHGGFETVLGYAVGQALLAGYNLCCRYNGLPVLPPIYLP